MRALGNRSLTPRQRSLVELAVLLLPLAPLGCTESAAANDAMTHATAADGVATGFSVSGARFIRNTIGFQGPESVRYDPELDAFFVSNMTGYGSAQDGNGYIVRVSASTEDSAVVLAQGGVNGVTLDAPRGSRSMATRSGRPTSRPCARSTSARARHSRRSTSRRTARCS